MLLKEYATGTAHLYDLEMKALKAWQADKTNENKKATWEAIVKAQQFCRKAFNDRNYYYQAAKERDETIGILDVEVASLKAENKVLTESRQEAWDRIAAFERDYSGKV